MKKIIALVLALIMAASMLTACSSEPKESGSSPAATESQSAKEEKTKIAMFVPLTGDFKQYGDAIVRGAKLAIKIFNRDNGTKFELDVFDDKGDPNESVNLANKIVADGSYFAAMGSYTSSCAMATVPVFEEANMLLYSPTGSHEDFPLMSPITIPMGITKKYDCALQVNELVKRFPEKKTMGMIYQNTDNGVVVANATTKAFEEHGGKVIVSETFTPNQTSDFTPLLSKIKESGADILYVESGYVDGAKIFNQALALGMDTSTTLFLANGTQLKPEFLDLVGDKGNGIVFITTMVSYQKKLLEGKQLDPEITKFLEEYKQEYNLEEPDAFVCQGYDSTMNLITSAHKVGTKTEDLIKQCLKFEGFYPVSGKDMSYTEHKELLKNYQFVYIVEDSEFLYLDDWLAAQK